ncbi:MAG TPA: DUF1064 domain-containing protein [Bacilli bacterium]|nr:DUF1064 domain-containing protein [Bacilli bacterium]
MYIKKYNFKNKFRNCSTEYNGQRYDSKLEANYAYQLDMLKKAKQIKDWDRQVTIQINFKKIKGEWILTDETTNELKDKNIECYHFRNYRIDFVVKHLDGSLEYVEVKGMELPDWKMKWDLTEMIFDKYKNRRLTLQK